MGRGGSTGSVVLLGLVFASQQDPVVFSHGQNIIMCHLSTWSTYRPGDYKFSHSKIQPQLCTHIVYKYFGINGSTSEMVSLDDWVNFQGPKGGLGMLQHLTKIKLDNPKLKLLMSVGGWDEGSEKFSKMASTAETRRTFVTDYGFDGLEIAWQYPATRGGVAEDKPNLITLLKELRTQFNKNKLLLSIYVPSKDYMIDPGYDIPAINGEVDYISLITHEYNGHWDGKLGPLAPLDSDDNFNVKYTVNTFLERGARPDKLILGIAAYGVNYLLTEGSPEVRMGLHTNGTFKPSFSSADGFTSYFEICKNLNDGWKEVWDDESSTPLAVDGLKAVSFENSRSISKKMEFIVSKKLGGVAVTSIDQDDFNGACQRGEYPLLTTILKSLGKPMINLQTSIEILTHNYGE